MLVKYIYYSTSKWFRDLQYPLLFFFFFLLISNSSFWFLPEAWKLHGDAIWRALCDSFDVTIFNLLRVNLQWVLFCSFSHIWSISVSMSWYFMQVCSISLLEPLTMVPIVFLLFCFVLLSRCMMPFYWRIPRFSLSFY